MKKIIFILAVCVLSIAATSCRKEIVQPESQQELEKDCCGENGSDPSDPGGKG